MTGISGAAQAVALTRAALYDDCLIPFKADPDEIASIRRAGQLEAIKGYVTAGAGPDASSQITLTKIVADADLKSIFQFLELLRLNGKFSDDDLRRLDTMYPHLQISKALHDFEQHSSEKREGNY